MSLLSALHTVGKDLSHVGTWIEDGLKVGVQVASVVDPPIGLIFTQVENVVTGIQAATSQPITSATLQTLVTELTAAISKATVPAPVPAVT